MLVLISKSKYFGYRIGIGDNFSFFDFEIKTNIEKNKRIKLTMGNAEINGPSSYSVSVNTDWVELAVILGFVSITLFA